MKERKERNMSSNMSLSTNCHSLCVWERGVVAGWFGGTLNDFSIERERRDYKITEKSLVII
jgi:hypothetical protein